LLLVTTLLAVTACSGSDDPGADGATTVPTVVEVIGGDDEDPFADAPTVDPDDFDLEIDDDVIIATEDGEIPPTSTEPPIEDTPDAPPVDSGPETTVAPVALPEPESVGRIVSLSSTHTETLFALGLGEFVIAVDQESDFPEAAIALQNGVMTPDSADISELESLDPDIVVIGDDPTGIAGRLNGAGIATYVGPPADSLEEVFTQIEDIAQLVGRPDLAEDLVGSMRADIEAILNSLPESDSELTVFHEIDPTLFTAGNDSYLSDVYETLGLENIAGPGGPGQVAQLTNEEVIAADPDVIVLADSDCCGITIDSLAARPGWDAIEAIEDGAVVEVRDPWVMRWGPRVVDLMRAVAGGIIAAG